jgi:hypothetical protein
MCSVQSPLLHSMKLESLDNLVDLSSDSSEGAIPNVPLPTPTADTLISDSKCSEFSKFVFIPFHSLGHSNCSQPSCHPYTREYHAMPLTPNLDPCIQERTSFN